MFSTSMLGSQDMFSTPMIGSDHDMAVTKSFINGADFNFLKHLFVFSYIQKDLATIYNIKDVKF